MFGCKVSPAQPELLLFVLDPHKQREMKSFIRTGMHIIFATASVSDLTFSGWFLSSAQKVVDIFSLYINVVVPFYTHIILIYTHLY